MYNKKFVMCAAYCLTCIFAGFRVKCIELTFLNSPQSNKLLTQEEIKINSRQNISINLGVLLKRTDGFVKALESLTENEVYYEAVTFGKLLTLLVEELMALAIHSSIWWMRQSDKPIFKVVPSAQPKCISPHVQTIVRCRCWSSRRNLVTELYEGNTCCTMYTITGKDQQMLMVALLKDWREEANLKKWAPEPRVMTVYEIYCNRCHFWRLPMPSEPYRPITPGSSMNPPPSASGGAQWSQEA